MRKQDLRVARLLKKRIENLPSFKRMVAFGSRARGDASLESDLDLFIEVSDLDKQIQEQIQLAAWEISLENGVVISTFIASSYSLSNGMLSANPLLKAIDLDGIAI